MAQKTWKIGEYAQGGIIQAVTKGSQVSIIGKDWDVSAGTHRGSNQSNAKEFTRLTISTEQANADRLLMAKLNDLTTPYYSGVIMKWISNKVKFNNQIFI